MTRSTSRRLAVHRQQKAYRIASIEEFLSARAFSEGTRHIYRADLQEFSRFSRVDTWSQVQMEHVVQWNDALKERVKDVTRRRKLAALRSFFRYAIKRGWASADPTLAVDLPSPPKNQGAELLTLRETRLILSAPDRRTRRGKRDAAILALLAHGLRLAEVAGLNRKDIIGPRPGHQPIAKVRGKGNRYRRVPVSLDTWQLTRDYWATLPDDLEPAFTGHRSKRISRRTIQLAVKRYAARVGIDAAKAHPHAFRHGYCTRLLEADVDLEAVRRLAGHESIGTTVRYAHLDTRTLERAAAKDPLGPHIRRKRGAIIVSIEDGWQRRQQESR